MSKYKKQQSSAETIEAAEKIARATQKPNQTKEQTKLIAQGIQKGIAEYKKQQKVKAHELGKLKKQYTQKINSQNQQSNIPLEIDNNNETICKIQWLPWGLLIISWLSFAVFVTLNNNVI